jgi:uncharacterized protein YwqG
MAIYNINTNRFEDEAPKTEVAPGILLTKPLADRWPQLAKSRLPYVQIEAIPAPLLPLDVSKFGGGFLLPEHIPYPTDSRGERMFPLAQLNFAEIPRLEGFPEKGWLQFYTSTNDIFGLDFEAPASQKDFRVLYFEEVDENRLHINTKPTEEMYEHSPIIMQHALTFSLQDDYMGMADIRFEKQFGKDVDSFIEEFGEQSGDVYNELAETFSGQGHKIGGYAFFTQSDPRYIHQQFKDHILLLQIDSIGDHIMWGDSGVANFFIHPDKLRAKDFSDVMYNWDCT